MERAPAAARDEAPDAARIGGAICDDEGAGLAAIPTLNTLPSALDPPVHSMHKARALVDSLASVGVSPEQALRGTGIQARDLDNVAARMSIRQLLALFRNAATSVDDPTFALRAGKERHLSILGYFGLALATSVDWPMSMERFEKYRQLSTPVLGVRFFPEPDACVMTYYDALDIDPDIFTFVLDYHMAMALTFQRDMFGPEFRFREVRLSYPAPPHAAEIEAIFEAPVSFGAEHNQLLWDAAWNARPIRLADPLTGQTLAEICDQLNAQVMAQSGKAGAVIQILEQCRGAFPGIDEVAAQLNVTSRTLRRRLAAEGTSFADILDALRARIAIRYLRATHIKTDEISQLLGFSTPASFRAAFRRWTGRQPSHYRPHSRARADLPEVACACGPSGTHENATEDGA